MVVAASSWTAYSMPRAENAPVFVREVLPGNSRTEITLVLYEMLSEARRRPVASSGPPEVGVKSAVNTPTFCPWRAQNPVQKGWCSKVGVEILKNTPTCTPGLRDFVMDAHLHAGLTWPVMGTPTCARIGHGRLPKASLTAARRAAARPLPCGTCRGKRS